MNNLEIFARRLKNARIMCGYSMDELVEKMNHSISKMSVSKYEAGIMLPESSVLINLANALSQKVDYFFRPFSVSLGQINFRKRASLSIKNEKAIKQKVLDFSERYIEIEQICNQNTSFKSPYTSIIYNEEDARKAVEIIKEKWEIGSDCIFNVIELLEEHSIRVFELDADMKFDGLCANLGSNGAVIVINKNFQPERKRLTALHELGHLILNFDSLLEEKKKEFLCNLFANEMLISENRLKSYLGNTRHDISYQELKTIQMQYGISCDTLMYKVHSCGIISDNRYKTYCVQKNMNLEFKKMVEDSLYQSESSTRFSRLVYRALSSDLITESKAASLLNTDQQTVHKELALV